MKENRVPDYGDFGLVSIEGGVGKLIRFGQWLNGDGFYNYEHAFMYIGHNQIIEAQPGGAVISQLDKYDGRDILWSTGLIHLNAIQRNNLVTYAVQQIGTPYSFLDYLAIALYRIGIKHPGIAKRVENSEHLICSQLVAVDYDKVGSPIGDIPPYLVTPGKLTKYLLKLNNHVN